MSMYLSCGIGVSYLFLEKSMKVGCGRTLLSVMRPEREARAKSTYHLAGLGPRIVKSLPYLLCAICSI